MLLASALNKQTKTIPQLIIPSPRHKAETGILKQSESNVDRAQCMKGKEDWGRGAWISTSKLSLEQNIESQPNLRDALCLFGSNQRGLRLREPRGSEHLFFLNVYNSSGPSGSNYIYSKESDGRNPWWLPVTTCKGAQLQLLVLGQSCGQDCAQKAYFKQISGYLAFHK